MTSEMKSRIDQYSELLVENLNNGTIKKKCLPNHGEEFSGAREEVALFKYKRYIGSLNWLLDLNTIKELEYLGY